MKAGIFASSLCFLVYAELREEEKCHDSLSPTSPCTMQVSAHLVPWRWRPRRLFVACLARSTVLPQTAGKTRVSQGSSAVVTEILLLARSCAR